MITGLSGRCCLPTDVEDPLTQLSTLTERQRRSCGWSAMPLATRPSPTVAQWRRWVNQTREPFSLAKQSKWRGFGPANHVLLCDFTESGVGRSSAGTRRVPILAGDRDC